MSNFRKVFVLREVEIPMEDVKPGDIFRLQPASPEDAVNVGHHEYFIAKDCTPDTDGDKSSVVASGLGFIETIDPRILRFRA